MQSGSVSIGSCCSVVLVAFEEGLSEDETGYSRADYEDV